MKPVLLLVKHDSHLDDNEFTITRRSIRYHSPVCLRVVHETGGDGMSATAVVLEATTTLTANLEPSGVPLLLILAKDNRTRD